MSQVLLINPGRKSKRASGKTRRKGTRSAAQRRATAKLVAYSRSKSRTRRAKSTPRSHNPIRVYKRAARQRNPLTIYSKARRVTRRRSPATSRSMGGGLLNFRSYINPIKDAAIMGAGAVAVDVAFGYINRYLPASMQVVPGTVGAGDAVKAVLTVALGKMLSGPTRGMSQKAAMGSLVVQMRDITMKVLPPSITAPSLSFYNPGRVVPGYGVRAQTNARAVGGGGGVSGGTVGAYTNGVSPLLGTPSMGPGLSRYTNQPGTPLLAGRLAASGFRR